MCLFFWEVFFMRKILNYIYVLFFGKYTLDGFLDDKSATKNTYVFDSIFPDKKSMEQVFPLNK